MTEAIAKDVDVKEVQETSEQAPMKTKHEEDMEALIARRSTENGNAIEQDPEKDPTETEDKGAEKEPVKKEIKTVDLYDDDGNIIKVPTTAKYKAKIDGQEIDVPFDKMTRSYQVGAAADKRMEEASRLQKALEEKELDLEKKGKELSAREQTFLDQMQSLDEKKDTGTLSDDAYRAKAKKLLNALTESDEPENDIVEVLKDLAPKIDHESITKKTEAKVIEALENYKKQQNEKAAQELKAAREKTIINANKRFEQEFSDIVEDSIAYSAAKNLAEQKFKQTPDAQPWEIAEAVGNEIREWKKGLSPETTRNKPAPTPRSVSARAKVGEDKKPETRKDILTEMKIARGQPA
jgi:hypothetical protein